MSEVASAKGTEEEVVVQGNVASDFPEFLREMYRIPLRFIEMASTVKAKGKPAAKASKGKAKSSSKRRAMLMLD